MDTGGPLRLLYTGTLPPYRGGSAISCHQLLLGLAGLGMELRCLAPMTPETREAAQRFDARHARLRVARYVVPAFDIAPPIPPPPGHRAAEEQALREAVPRWIAEHRPDVVIAGRESFGWDIPDLAHRHGLPVVLLVRGGSRTTALLEGRYPPALAQAWVARFRAADRVVAVSGHLAEGLRRLGVAGVCVIPNFVDLERFAPRSPAAGLRAALALAPNSIVVMHLANLQPRKRPLDLVAAARATAKDERLIYVIVGDGPMRRPMEQRCAAEGLSGRFRFVGWVDYDKVPEYLSLADVVVMPSESEGLSRVYLETQASGRVLVASDIPPAREVVRDGETGVLFPRGDPQALADRIQQAARDAELRERIGRAAREHARHFALDGAIATYASLLREAVATQARAAAR